MNKAIICKTESCLYFDCWIYTKVGWLPRKLTLILLVTDKENQKKHWHYHYCMTISMQQKYKIIGNNDKKYRIRNTKKKDLWLMRKNILMQIMNIYIKKNKKTCVNQFHFSYWFSISYICHLWFRAERRILHNLWSNNQFAIERGISEALSCIKWVCLVITFNILAPQLIFISTSYMELFDFFW